MLTLIIEYHNRVCRTHTLAIQYRHRKITKTWRKYIFELELSWGHNHYRDLFTYIGISTTKCALIVADSPPKAEEILGRDIGQRRKNLRAENRAALEG